MVLPLALWSFVQAAGIPLVFGCTVLLQPFWSLVQLVAFLWCWQGGVHCAPPACAASALLNYGGHKLFQGSMAGSKGL